MAGPSSSSDDDLARQLGPHLAPRLQPLLRLSPDAAAAVAGLRRFLAEVPAAADILRSAPTCLESLLVVFAHSQYLGDALLRWPQWLPWVAAAQREPGRDREAWAGAVAQAVAGASPADRIPCLHRFKLREYLRIMLRDVQGVAPLAESTQELSQLADATLHQAYLWAWNDLAGHWGSPQADGRLVGMSVLGLGKLGGQELNYSSDIDLMFVYDGDGETVGGVEATTNHEFFTRLAQALIQSITADPGGGAYRVDLRLRPGGREGELVLTRAHALDYYRLRAQPWELQMLLRARPCAGATAVGKRFLEEVAASVFPAQPDVAALAAAIRGGRDRMREQLRRHRALGQRRPHVDVKLDPGGIRDIEFLAQHLQRAHGRRDPWLRSPNTLVALQRLHDKGHLSGAELQLLSGAYTRLRHIEHRLQLRWGQQTHTLPAQPERWAALARSLAVWTPALHPASDSHAGDDLQTALEGAMLAVRALYDRHLGALPVPPPPSPAPSPTLPPRPLPWQRWLRTLAADPSAAAILETLPDSQRLRLQHAVEASAWMAGILARQPALLLHCFPAGEAAWRCPQPSGHPLPAIEATTPSERQLAVRASRERSESGVEVPPPRPTPTFDAAMRALRQSWQHCCLQSTLQEFEHARPAAAVLADLTAAAEQIVIAGLDIALAACAPAPLAVLGLGRMGWGELDLLGDLDLVFIAEEGAGESANRLAAKLIEVLGAYTQAGSLFAVDTRLRPGGGEGELVHSPTALGAYFEQRADVWEALSYLKARPLAGDPGLAQRALTAVHAALPVRFGDAALLRQALLPLRVRIEREGRPGHWGFKTAPGGYYDVDFLVSMARLRGTALPAGPLAVQAAALAPELGGHAARLRAADHALRVATGKAGAALPAAGEGVERASAWFRRAWPEALPPDQSLESLVFHSRRRIREFYLECL